MELSNQCHASSLSCGGLSPYYVLLLAILLGCGQHDEITRYTVPKPELVDPTLVASAAVQPAVMTEQQTLGLIVPVGDMGWFFKLTGSLEAVEPLYNKVKPLRI